jgi:hypothetical protein
MKTRIGWREWLVLPELKIPGIKATIDTGARTSSLHAFFVETTSHQGLEMVRFGVHPLQFREDVQCICWAPLKERRLVTDSGGHSEERLVIESPIRLGGLEHRIELTLTNRDSMKFRMLLGRSALQALGAVVDPCHSYLLGKSLKKAYFNPRESNL